MALKDIFGGGKTASADTVLTPEEDLDTIEDEESSYRTVMTPYPVDGGADELDVNEEEDERVMAQSSIKVANYDTYSLAKLTEVIMLVRDGYTVFISFESLVTKYKSMSLEKAEVEIKSKSEINQFCNALLGAKIALDATFDKLGEFTYIFAPYGVDVAKIKGEPSKEDVAE